MPTYALIGASTFNAEDFLSRYRAGAFDCVVAIDSGLKHLQNVDVVPDVVLGDFDSLGYVPEGAFVYPAIKDKSDLELALDYAQGQGANDFMLYGCLEGRLDHTLAALQNIASVAEEGRRVRAIGSPWGDREGANPRMLRATMLEALAGPCSLTISARNQVEPETVADLGAATYGSVSVFAATDAAYGVTETGMFYSLEATTLTNRTSLGLSNELVCREGRISVEKGTLFVLYPADLQTCFLRGAVESA